MLANDIQIQRQREEPRFNGNAKLQYLIRVDFMVGEDGPFTEWFIKEAFSAAARDEKLNAFAEHVRRPNA